jgi:hypothetical protein
MRALPIEAVDPDTGGIVATVDWTDSVGGDCRIRATILPGQERTFTVDPFNPDGAVLRALGWIEEATR